MGTIVVKRPGTPLNFKHSGGDAAITLASLANGSYRQSAKIDLGATFPEEYRVSASLEFGATPTSGARCDVYWVPSSDADAGDDNAAAASGTNASYTGYSSNPAAAVLQAVFLGSFVCTAQATGTVQRGEIASFYPKSRYGSIIYFNNSGAAMHSTNDNQCITFTPIETVLVAE